MTLGLPHEGRIKGLVGEVLVGIKCTGGSKDSDWGRGVLLEP